jgi:hypothetical protein
MDEDEKRQMIFKQRIADPGNICFNRGCTQYRVTVKKQRSGRTYKNLSSAWPHLPRVVV